MPRALWLPNRGWLILTSEVPLYGVGSIYTSRELLGGIELLGAILDRGHLPGRILVVDDAPLVLRFQGETNYERAREKERDIERGTGRGE